MEKMKMNLEMTAKTHDQLMAIKGRVQAASKAEVLRRALAVYDMVTDLDQQGVTIVAQHPDGNKERLVVVG